MSKGIFVIYNKTTSAMLTIRTAGGRATKWYYGQAAAKAALSSTALSRVPGTD